MSARAKALNGEESCDCSFATPTVLRVIIFKSRPLVCFEPVKEKLHGGVKFL
jgi:hypothetical protein